MTPSSLANLRELLCCLREGQLSPEQAIQLDGLLSADPEARLFYVRYMDLCANLFWSVLSDDGHRQLMAQVLEAPKSEVPPSSPFPSLLDTMSHGATGNFSGWPVAYLVATVIFGIGLLMGSLVHVSEPQQIAEQCSAAEQVEPRAKERTCRPDHRHGRLPVGKGFRVQSSGFRHSKSEIRNQKSKISRRARRQIRPGLGTNGNHLRHGAKVILQGPVTYEVESKNGGYLSVGKLTARVESGEWRVESNQTTAKPQAANHSLTLHSPLSTLHYQNSHRHRHRSGHGVWRRGEQGGAHHLARVSRLGQAGGVPAMERQKKLSRSCTRTNRPAWRMAAIRAAAIAS